MAKCCVRILVVIYVCSVSLLTAKAPLDKCYFPAYKKEARFCNSTEFEDEDIKKTKADTKECKQAKLESSYEQYVKNLVSLIDTIKVPEYKRGENNEQIKEYSISLSNTLISALSFDFGYYDNERFEENYTLEPGKCMAERTYKDIREATECNGKSCTTKGYDDSGKIIFEANCINGLNHGLQRLYDKSGNLIMELNYKQGELDGKQKLPNYITFDKSNEENKLIINNVEIINGKLNGKINIEYKEEHRPFAGLVCLVPTNDSSFSGEFKKGKPISNIKLWEYHYDRYPSEENRIIPFDNNSVINGNGAYEISFDEAIVPSHNECEISNYQNGKIVSFEFINSHSIHNPIKCSKETFNKIKQENNITANATTNENDYSSYRLSYTSGQFDKKEQKNGIWIEKTIYYADHDDSKIYKIESSETNYKNNELNGARKEWINNKLIKEEIYENGKLNGTLKEWDNNGNMIKAEIYKNGNRVQIIR